MTLVTRKKANKINDKQLTLLNDIMLVSIRHDKINLLDYRDLDKDTLKSVLNNILNKGVELMGYTAVYNTIMKLDNTLSDAQINTALFRWYEDSMRLSWLDRRVNKVNDIPTHEHINNLGMTIEDYKKSFPSIAKFIRDMKVNDCYAMPYFNQATFEYMQWHINGGYGTAQRDYNKEIKISTFKCERTMTYYFKRIA